MPPFLPFGHCVCPVAQFPLPPFPSIPPLPQASRSPKSHVETGEQESRPTACGAESMPNHTQGDSDLTIGPVFDIDRPVSHPLSCERSWCFLFLVTETFCCARFPVEKGGGGRGVHARGGGPGFPFPDAPHVVACKSTMIQNRCPFETFQQRYGVDIKRSSSPTGQRSDFAPRSV